jgi:hypothetical protein
VLNQFSIQQATSSQNGYLSSSDWLTFDGKQNAGNYITQLTGEASASGPGSATITLNNLAVINKTLTGLTVSGGTINSSDSILSAFGKLQNQINGVVTGLDYQGTWNASLNIPNLVSGIGTNGDYYVVDVAGGTNLDGITDWNVGDWAIFNGSTWQKLDNSESVSSVNGLTGAVVLTTTNIAEGTNLYFTQGRVSANADVSANTFARHNAVTLGTANGLSLSTQQLSLGLASSSTTGALSSTDWNTFNARVSGTIDTGQVAFGTAANTVGGEGFFTYNNSTKTLSLRDSTNTYSSTIATISVNAEITASVGSLLVNVGGNVLRGLQVRRGGNTVWDLGGSGEIKSSTSGAGTSASIYAGADGAFGFYSVGTTQRLPVMRPIRTNNDNYGVKLVHKNAAVETDGIILQSNGNVQIGTTTDAGFKLDVNGTARVQGVATITGSTTAASSIARGANLTSTLVAAANNDVLVGLDINPTFTNGTFTGLDNQALRVTGTSASERGNTFGVGAAIATFRNNTTSTGFDPVYIVKFNRQNSATASWYFGNDANNNGVIATNNSSLRIGKDTSGTYTEHLRIFPSTGNLVLQDGGTFTDAGFRLDVNGTARVQGNLTTNLTAGSVPFIGASGLLSQDNTNLFWDNTNKRLGIGTSTPIRALSINFGGGASVIRIQRSTANTLGATGAIEFSNSLAQVVSGVSCVAEGIEDSSSLRFHTSNGANVTSIYNLTERLRITHTGNTLINTTTDAGFRLDVNGTARVQGTVANALTVQRTTATSNIYIRYQNETNSWYAGQTDTGSFGIGTDAALGGGILFNLTTGGNLLLGSVTNSGQRLQVTGTSLLNGLSTIQGTTASDTAPLGAELTTTGSGTNWTGTDFATGYTHAVGSTVPLSTSLVATNGIYYQIAYTITGRTAGSITISYGGVSTSGITATGAVGPRAISTVPLSIVPTTDFDGTLVLSIKVISTSSASVTFNSSAGTTTNQIRISSINSNTFVGRESGRNNTTATNNSFFGAGSGQSNTTGGSNSFFGTASGQANITGGSNSFFGSSSGLNNTTAVFNSFFGASSGQANTTGSSNSFFGQNSGLLNTIGESNSFFGRSSGAANTTGGANSFFGASAGQSNTTGGSNSFFGVNAGFSNTTGVCNSFFGNTSGSNNTTGGNNVFLGFDAGRRISAGTSLTIANNSIFIGNDTRALADNQSNQIVIGRESIGLGSNTTVLGNTSTTHGRWYGSLLLGTTTNAASSILTMESTTQGFLPPRMTSAQRTAIASPAEGLLVIQTDGIQGLYIYINATWRAVTMV